MEHTHQKRVTHCPLTARHRLAEGVGKQHQHGQQPPEQIKPRRGALIQLRCGGSGQTKPSFSALATAPVRVFTSSLRYTPRR